VFKSVVFDFFINDIYLLAQYIYTYYIIYITLRDLVRYRDVETYKLNK